MDRRVLWRGVLLVLLLLAFAVRLSGLTAQSLWRDEVDAIRFSQGPLTTLFRNFTRVGWNGPLYYAFLRLWIAVAGQTEFALRFFSLGFGLLAVALTVRLARAWFTPAVAALAGLLMALSPYMVWYSQENKMYALVSALVLATVWLFYLAIVKNHWLLWMGVLVALWFTTGVHVMGALLVPVLILFFLIWWPVARRRWRQALVVLVVAVAPSLVALPWAGPLLIRGGDIGHRFVDLRGMVMMMLHAFSRGILAQGRELPIVLSLFCLLAGSLLWNEWSLFRGPYNPERGYRPERGYVLALWTWMVVPVLGLYGISLRIPMFVDRYLIWIGPAFYVLVARGLEQIRRLSTILWSICLVLMLWLSGRGIVQQTTTPIKSDFRGAAAYVAAHRQPEDLVLFHISYVRYTFEYYYGPSSPYADGIPTDDNTTEDLVDALMRERTQGYGTVWLVLSEPDMWDRRGMTVDWLEAHAKEETRQDLTLVSVIRYRMLE